MTARIVALVVAWVAAVGLAGCITPSEPSDPPTSSTSSRPPAQQVPQDRDKDAVLAALRRVDLCAVVDAAMTATSVLPASAEPRAREPFGCVVEGLWPSISVNVVNYEHRTRVSMQTRALGGVKAYVRDGPDSCAVLLPVSFELVIEFLQSGFDEVEACRPISELAAASASVLADPGVARVDPRWDACTVLAEVLEPEVDRSKLVGNGPNDCGNYSESPSFLGLSFVDYFVAEGEPRIATVGGTQVQIYEQDDACDIYWRHGPFNSRFADTPDHQVQLRALDCERATALAESVMGVLAGPPPSDAAEQRPLFYSPDEPDGPFLGECAYVEDVSNARDCEPYREVPVPADILAAAYEDANVQCAVSVDAVGKHFGQRLRPVAVSDSGSDCHFVEPERSMQLEFKVRGGRTASISDVREVTIAGHPGFVESGSGFYKYEISTSSTVEGDGAIELTVRTGPVIAVDTPLPAGTDKKAEAVLTEVLRKYFS